MVATTGSNEDWQARVSHGLASQLRADAELSGLDGRANIVKAGLELLHRHAREERMARDVEEFYGEASPGLPLGVLPAEDDATADR